MDRDQRVRRLHRDLIRVVHSIAQAGARELAEQGMTPAQYQLLVAVDRRPDCTQQQLGDLLGVTKGNVSMLVTRLEDAGLVARRPQGAAHCIVLTPQGRRRLAELQPAHARFVAERFAALDDEQLGHLQELLAALDEPA